MSFGHNRSCALFLAVVLLPLSTFCWQEPVEYSKAAYYIAPGGLGTPNGACGYGEYGRTINDGCVAVVSPSKLYRDGAGCGACYQVRCKAAECNEEGVTVVVTDQGGGPDTDFILSAPAFTKMAQPGCEKQLMVYGKVDIEYQRVPCKYPGKTLMLKVTELSRYDYYLCLEFLYQSGTSDITAVEILEEETLSWRPCQRAYGAVWDLSNPPKGALTVRFFLAGSTTVKARWVLVPTVIPVVWQPGVAYDTSIILDD